MNYIPNILFVVALIIGIGYFTKNVKKLIRNIKLGQNIDVSDNKGQRWKNMAMIALGQSKMVKKPIAGILHIIVYVGFVIINIEVLEIIIDGNFDLSTLSTDFTQDQIFRFVVVPSDFATTTGVDVSNYNAVMSALNIQDRNIPVIDLDQ